MKCTVMKVGPALAKKWLAKNTRNRAVRTSIVAKYARILRAGEWMLTHEGIAFNKAGVLLDGQHRLLAIEETGMTVEILVCTGVADETFAHINDGAMRNAADKLGEDKRHAEVVRLAAKHMLGRAPTSKELLNMNESIGWAAAELLKFCGSSSKFFSCARIKLAAICYILCGEGDFALDAYRKLNLNDIPNLHPSAMSMVKQVLKGQLVSTKSTDVLSAAVIVFDKDRQHITRLASCDPSAAGPWVKRILQESYMANAA